MRGLQEVLEHAEALAFGDEVEAGALVYEVDDGAGGLLDFQTEEIVFEGADAVGAARAGGLRRGSFCTTSAR